MAHNVYAVAEPASLTSTEPHPSMIPRPLPFITQVAPVGPERPQAAEPATDLILIQAPPGPPDLREER